MIRAYQQQDFVQVINLFQRNVPQYFSAEEEKDLFHYLQHETEDYFVYENDGQIWAAGGINYNSKENLAIISWDFVHPDQHRKGIGSKLMQHRFEVIAAHKKMDQIRVRTSQFSYPFYQKMGFSIEKIVKDFWAVGYDLVQMKKCL